MTFPPWATNASIGRGVRARRPAESRRGFRPGVMESCVLIFLWLLLSPPAEAALLTVTNTEDSGPGSLRQALLDANNTPGPDNIHFSIPGPGPHTITPETDLPAISGPVTIDGYTQAGASPNTLPNGNNAVLAIEVDGNNAGMG